MTYKILFYIIIFLLLVLGAATMAVVRKGGTVGLTPIPGVGVVYQKVTSVYENEDTKDLIYSHNIIIGLLFIYIVFKWEEGYGPEDLDNDLKLESNAN